VLVGDDGEGEDRRILGTKRTCQMMEMQILRMSDELIFRN
jgi:hypothetical protein